MGGRCGTPHRGKAGAQVTARPPRLLVLLALVVAVLMLVGDARAITFPWPTRKPDTYYMRKLKAGGYALCGFWVYKVGPVSHTAELCTWRATAKGAA